ncbi:MAG: DUF4411 family protein [Bacillota bacterium]
MSTQTTYLLDANIFLTPFQYYYPFDIAKPFWLFLEDSMESGTLVIAKKVYDEVTKVPDELSEWMKRLSINCVDHRPIDVLNNYRAVLNHIQTDTKCYTIKALTVWSDIKVADPWLLAIAMTYGYTIVTLEIPNNSLGSTPSNKVKIPDVCEYFHVPCINLFEMLRRLNFTF